jgi:hypothetical protein
MMITSTLLLGKNFRLIGWSRMHATDAAKSVVTVDGFGSNGTLQSTAKRTSTAQQMSGCAKAAGRFMQSTAGFGKSSGVFPMNQITRTHAKSSSNFPVVSTIGGRHVELVLVWLCFVATTAHAASPSTTENQLADSETSLNLGGMPQENRVWPAQRQSDDYEVASSIFLGISPTPHDVGDRDERLRRQSKGSILACVGSKCFDNYITCSNAAGYYDYEAYTDSIDACMGMLDDRDGRCSSLAEFQSANEACGIILDDECEGGASAAGSYCECPRRTTSCSGSGCTSDVHGGHIWFYWSAGGCGGAGC